MLDEHFHFISDSIRCESFKLAISKNLNPDDLVVDLGCGSGVLGLFCLQAGAALVYEVDISAMLEIAKETIARAGLDSQAVFLQGRSSQVELPQQVDVAICDHIGCFGFDYGIVGLFNDARGRLLKPGGVLVPARLNLQLAALESEKCHCLVQRWTSASIPSEYHWLAEHEKNTKHLVNLTSDELLSEPELMGSIDLYENNPEYFSWTVDFFIGRDGILHGLGGWCETELAQDVWISNSPLAERRISRSQVFLPIGEPVRVKKGDQVKATIMTRPADNLIVWAVDLPATGHHFKHSTWQTLMLNPELIRMAPERVLELRPESHAQLTVMSYCDGRRTYREIEDAVLRDHPRLLPSPEEITRFVAEVLGRNT